MANLQAENLNLSEKLRIAEEKACRHEQALKEAEEEINNQKSILREAQMTIHLHQQDILDWMALSEWYQLRCLQCSEVLGQAMAFLQGFPSEITAWPSGQA